MRFGGSSRKIATALRGSVCGRHVRALSSGGERFPDTEEVTSSNLVAPTNIFAGQRLGLLAFIFTCRAMMRAEHPPGSVYRLPAHVYLQCPAKLG